MNTILVPIIHTILNMSTYLKKFHRKNSTVTTVMMMALPIRILYTV